MTLDTRRWVRPEDLNANGTLFGGSLLRWIDEEAAIYAILPLGDERVVFVDLDDGGMPLEPGYSTITEDRDRIPRRHASAIPRGRPDR
ncbi:hypothetical protein GCM10009792_07810 [Microcella alkalica]|uniref:Acyl-CoA thioesterase n=1 Tax=Microcella alkalica TaxID=355930 RepID=A0A839E2D4_9MICO|nr:hypothetical protein [Microcella alkalica]MBA8846521.1 hypothetical protein [Microcella alkalica]